MPEPQRDMTFEEFLTYKVLLIVAMAVGPALIVLGGKNLGRWCVEHQVLCRPDQALFEVPLIKAGPNTIQLIVGIFAFCALLAAAAGSGVSARRRRVQRELGE